MSVDKRRSRRRALAASGMLYDLAGRQIGAATLRNMSDTGAQIETATELELPARFLIAFARSGSVRRRCEKVWQTGTIAGVRFVPAPR